MQGCVQPDWGYFESNQIKSKSFIFLLKKSVHFITINISSQELFKPTCIINYIN